MKRRWRLVRPAGETVRTAILACLIAMLLAGSVAMVSAARTLDIAPKVGDILVYRQGARLPQDWEFTVNLTPTKTCVMAPAVMASQGGSLVVEERLENAASYRAHWAGGPTSHGDTDCGSSVDLVMHREELQLLSNAVGGPGVEHRVFSYF
jgi:hypothetical protein